MLSGAGETITVLEAVTQVADTVCSLELHPAAVRVTVIVLIETPQDIVMFQLHSTEVLFIVFMFVQLTKASCFQDIVVSIEAILSYTAFLLGATDVTQSQVEA